MDETAYLSLSVETTFPRHKPSLYSSYKRVLLAQRFSATSRVENPRPVHIFHTLAHLQSGISKAKCGKSAYLSPDTLLFISRCHRRSRRQLGTGNQDGNKYHGHEILDNGIPGLSNMTRKGIRVVPALRLCRSDVILLYVRGHYMRVH